MATRGQRRGAEIFIEGAEIFMKGAEIFKEGCRNLGGLGQKSDRSSGEEHTILGYSWARIGSQSIICQCSCKALSQKCYVLSLVVLSNFIQCALPNHSCGISRHPLQRFSPPSSVPFLLFGKNAFTKYVLYLLNLPTHKSY